MTEFQHKIDFKLVFAAHNANPNGDPLNGNRPRQNFAGYGEVSDVAIKRKIRNRLQDLGNPIFVQSNDRNDDGLDSLRARVESIPELKKNKDADDYARIACATWLDVRAFGQVFAFKGDSSKGVSVPVRGPVSIQIAESVNPITINDMQITKSVNSEPGGGRGSDTMGTKHFVDFGYYVVNGSINTQLAEKTGFSEEDAEQIKQALLTLFENDASSARPEGSMEVVKLFWWTHPSKLGKYPAARVHRSVQVVPVDSDIVPTKVDDYRLEVVDDLPGVTLDVYPED
ncbi:type I-C CRISPR-associated protein Cas7/Csd2 [Lapidilactobacillus luobeiensis]|uniref:type I-C CRISPR-associated protein Cas7/Csd2 n=1 Tax=Lapidilactobacillus luobeiensis TaxID=2950371 RepID=UPI0021C37B1F|nr:type I-C CRISPR-associated protein Cas7/Csd2 [Lapidilactobacillus luobeiensis]